MLEEVKKWYDEGLPVSGYLEHQIKLRQLVEIIRKEFDKGTKKLNYEWDNFRCVKPYYRWITTKWEGNGIKIVADNHVPESTDLKEIRYEFESFDDLLHYMFDKNPFKSELWITVELEEHFQKFKYVKGELILHEKSWKKCDQYGQRII